MTVIFTVVCYFFLGFLPRRWLARKDAFLMPASLIPHGGFATHPRYRDLNGIGKLLYVLFYVGAAVMMLLITVLGLSESG